MTASRVFTELLSNSPKPLPRFSPGYEGMENMFYFFYIIIIFSVNKEKDDIQSAHCKFLQLVDSQTITDQRTGSSY